MSLIETKKLSFTYQGADRPAIEGVNIAVEPGEILILAGPSGSGKSTLLGMLKPELMPAGKVSGEVLFDGKPMPSVSTPDTVGRIGYVGQDPEAQIVMDEVGRELTYASENMGYGAAETSRRAAEVSAFFGITSWFRRKTWELSGGQKQVLNLASVMTLSPDILLLDEPTARLDPVTAAEFISLLVRLNREFGTAVVIAEHSIDNMIEFAHRICVLRDGTITASGSVREVLETGALGDAEPESARLWRLFGRKGECPLGISEMSRFVRENAPKCSFAPEASENETAAAGDTVLRLKNVWFRYGKTDEYILRRANFSVLRGSIHTVMGANGSGKTTLLKALAGMIKPADGKRVAGKDLRVAMVPQDVTELFIYDTVGEIISDAAGTETRALEIEKKLNITGLLNRHPLRVSGGEKQRVALAAVLVSNPDVLLLDEPTKNLDSSSRKALYGILDELRRSGIAVVAVSHDPDMAIHSDACSILFDGGVSEPEDSRTFLCRNRFFTSGTVRACRGIIEGAVTPEEAAEAAKQ